MYCSGCGSQIQPGLSYCSRCGKRVSDETRPADRGRMSFTVAGNIAGVAFVAFIFVLLVLVLNGVNGSNVVGVTFFYFLALFGLCFLFLRHSRNETRSLPEVPVGEPLYIEPAVTAQLQEAKDRPASVTEHTTRTLDKIAVERD